MIYDEDALRQSIETGERRLAALKQAARRRKKWQKALLVVLIGAAMLGTAAFVASKRVPGAPHFVVTWPQSTTPQSVASGQTLLAREGQPFDVAVSESSKWNVTWNSSGMAQSGESVSWAPQKGGELLLARCRARNSDWTAYFSKVVPPRDLSMGSIAPGLSDGFRRTVSLSGQGAWVFPSVQAVGNVGWDERALPPLSAAASVEPNTLLSQKLDAVNDAPTPALWQIVSNFDGDVKAPTEDGATYALLREADLETTMPQIGAKLVQLAPDASIKWILRLDKDVPEGVVRLSFDDKRQRQAWIKRKGSSVGTPVVGWENGQWKGVVTPEVPTPTPTSRQ